VSKEKSKEGLGEIYEKEFLKQTLGVQESDPLAGKKEEILKAFQRLCRKLDALTHFHYAPKPVVADVQINTNVPAIHMEEILPLAMSQVKTLCVLLFVLVFTSLRVLTWATLDLGRAMLLLRKRCTRRSAAARARSSRRKK